MPHAHADMPSSSPQKIEREKPVFKTSPTACTALIRTSKKTIPRYVDITIFIWPTVVVVNALGMLSAQKREKKRGAKKKAGKAGKARGETNETWPTIVVVTALECFVHKP